MSFMNNGKTTSSPSSKTMMKAGVWYTVSNFIMRALGFLTVPIFSRIMSGADYGSYSTFTACVTIMTVLTGFDAYTSIIRCKHEVDDDLDSYILSVLAVNTCVTILFYFTFLAFPSFYCDVFQVNEACIHYMFVYLLCLPAFNLISTKQRAFYRYKTFVILTALISVGSVVLSLSFVLLIKDGLTARIVGQYAPGVIVGAILYVYIIIKGKQIHWKYCKYVLHLCLPLLPHLLSVYVLSSSNRVLLTFLCGSETTAIYSIANSATNIVSVLFDSANKAWAPWLLDSMRDERYDEIRNVSNVYVLVLMAVALLTVMFGPEIVYILGGRRLMESQFMLPALVMGCAFQIIYTMYVNVEFYLKRTSITATATIVAATTGIIVSYLLISTFGYMAAPIGTAVSYGILLGAHYACVSSLGYRDIFDRRFVFGILAAFASICVIATSVLYAHLVLRLGIIAVFVICLALFLARNKKALRKMIKREN